MLAPKTTTWNNEFNAFWCGSEKAAGIFDGGPVKPGGGATAELVTPVESRGGWLASNAEPVPLATVLFAMVAV